ncbi:MAG: recombination-associated protein RdgC [Pseudomonadota bacterium]
MWFKSLQLFRIPSPAEITADGLAAQLEKHTLLPCSAMERQRVGWVAPNGKDSLVYSLNRQMLIALGAEKKLLPASVINQVAKERVADLEEQQGFKPGRKQAREIKERVTEELLPQAFSIRRNTLAWIDPVGGWVVVDSSNATKAEELLELLRKSADGFSPMPLKVNLSPVAAMTEWLVSNEAPSKFSVDLEAELQSSSEGKATVRYLRHALDAEEISRHIGKGKQCTRLALTWNDRVSFVLTDTLALKKLSFLDVVLEESGSQAETVEEQFDADFALMTGELSRLLEDVVAALGGEVAP